MSEMIGKRFIFLLEGDRRLCDIRNVHTCTNTAVPKNKQLRGEKAGTFIPACVGFVAPDKSSLDAEQRKLNDRKAG